MTNQELKEKLLEEFDELFLMKDGTLGRYSKLVDALKQTSLIKSFISTKLDALLLNEDEVEEAFQSGNHAYCVQSPMKEQIPRKVFVTQAIIKNQRDKLNKESV